jgi:FAD/FMN-containing dehydrogenase
MADVVAAVRFARDHDVEIAIRGRGHNVTGTALFDGGIVIDLSAMRAVRDPVDRRVWVQGGALWGDVDRESQAQGLATTGGIVSHTAVAGLALGGGIGWLLRKHGLRFGAAPPLPDIPKGLHWRPVVMVGACLDKEIFRRPRSFP